LITIGRLLLSYYNYLLDEKLPLNRFKQIKPCAVMCTLAFILKLAKIKGDAVEEYVFGIHVSVSAEESDCSIRRVDYFVLGENSCCLLYAIIVYL